ncbi:MAG: hypothetical protein ACREJN_15265, partial [Nitrospiraceae bacterium]
MKIWLLHLSLTPPTALMDLFTTLLGNVTMQRRLAATCLLVIILLSGIPPSISADSVIELPVLATIRQNNLGVFEILM